MAHYMKVKQIKRYLMLLGLLAGSDYLAFGQSWFQEGDFWVYRETYGLTGYDGYCELKVMGDTVINDRQVKQLDQYCKGYSQLYGQTYESTSTMYATEENGVIYISNEEDEIGEAIDFNLAAGDTYFFDREFFYWGCEDSLEYTIDSITTFEFEGSEHRIQHISYYDDWWEYPGTLNIYERIGSIYGSILIGNFDCFIDGSSYYTLCSFGSELDTVHFMENDCYLINSVNEVEVEQVFIYPNPTTNLLNIQSASTPQSIRIHDITGSLFISKINSRQIDLSQLPRGLYVLSLEFRDRVVLEKVLKR